jgi:hypothetical protein
MIMSLGPEGRGHPLAIYYRLTAILSTISPQDWKKEQEPDRRRDCSFDPLPLQTQQNLLHHVV